MQIHWRHPDKIAAQDRYFAIRRLSDLADGHGDLTDLWIDVAKGSRHHRRGDKRVTIRCLARRASVVGVGSDAEVGLALRSALGKIEREIARLRSRRLEHRRKEAARPPHVGIVDRLFPEEGYGFVLTDGGEQVYFHRNSLTPDLDFDLLEEGEQVALNYYAADSGSQASIVSCFSDLSEA